MLRSLFIVIFLNALSFEATVGIFFCEEWVNSVSFENESVNFYMYTHANARPVQVVCNKNCDLSNSSFNPNLSTTVITHGFMSNYQANWIQSLIAQLFKSEQMNIIVADWSKYIRLNYAQTAQQTVNIAGQIDKLLTQLAKRSKKNLRDWPYIHFIGHSMGAHVVGQAATLLKPKVFVHRITAFDPAKPFFHNEGANLKLHKSSAQFVDVYHTNSAANEETFGLYEPLGHIDFYPNGGDRQPACSAGGRDGARRRLLRNPTGLQGLKCLSKKILGVNVINLRRNFWARELWQGNNMLCDHREGPKYFSQSLRGQLFIARKLDDSQTPFADCADMNCIENGCVEMGINAYLYSDPRYHGIYYVNTLCSLNFIPYELID